MPSDTLLNANQQRRKDRVAALAGVWTAHLEDLRPKGLRAYGRVNPELARHLEPHLNGLLALLEQLERSADGLPED